VYVVRSDHAVRTPVQLGAASVSEIEVLHGLAENDRVLFRTRVTSTTHPTC